MTTEPFLVRIRRWARAIKRDVLTLWFAARDRRVSWPIKIFCAAIAAYAFSPIDLIPDFIPVLGYLDDIILLPLAIMLAIRMLPPTPLAESRAAADQSAARPSSRVAAIVIVATWIVCGALLALAFWPGRGNA